jgi:hypothetical protein
MKSIFLIKEEASYLVLLSGADTHTHFSWNTKIRARTHNQTPLELISRLSKTVNTLKL